MIGVFDKAKEARYSGQAKVSNPWRGRMAKKPLWSVAFVGTGEVTEANVKALLDDWMTEAKDYNPPIIPKVIRRGHKGLMKVWDWLTAEFEDEIDKVDLEEIVSALIAARDDKKDPADKVFLLYIPAEGTPEAGSLESEHLAVVEEALAAGIPVLDMTQGLDDFQMAASEAEPPAEPQTPRRRGRSRSETPEPGESITGPPSEAELEASMADPNPPWRDDEEGQVLPGLQSLMQRAAPWEAPSGGIPVVLSQQTVQALLTAVAYLAADVKDSVIGALPEHVRPKPVSHPVYVSEDGRYRARASRGRPRKGETLADLTDAELADVKARGLWDE